MTSMYLKAIEIQIQDAFPQSKVTVFIEESPFYPHFEMIKAYVDEYGAYVAIGPWVQSVPEQAVADTLIRMIEEYMGGMRTE